MHLRRLGDTYAIARWPSEAALPAGIFTAGGIVSVTKRAGELSVVAEVTALSGLEGAEVVEPGWVAFEVAGPLDFALTGIMAELSSLLAAAEISLFAISTYDTDIVLVKAETADRAAAAWAAAGHSIA